MERVEVRRPAAACSKAEHPIHPVSTAISTSRQQTTLGGHNKNARRPRPRTTCPPPLDGASMTRGGNDVDDRHTRYCSPAWRQPRPGHPTGSAVAACAGPVFVGPWRPAKATATAVTASNPLSEPPLVLSPVPAPPKGPNSAEPVLALPPVGPPLILVSELPPDEAPSGIAGVAVATQTRRSCTPSL